jgi:multiple sugar transport system permease protein
MSKKEVRKWLFSIIAWGVALVWYSPILWMLSTSLKPTLVATTERPPRWLPDPLTFENYQAILSPAVGAGLLQAFINSVLVAVASVLLLLLVATPAAYALSRLRFWGRDVIFWSYVAVLAFPGAIFLIPHFLLIMHMGLMNNLWALILPGLGGTFGVFLLRQYMLGIPRELEDAAWVDGCSRLRFLIFIVVPLIKPALGVLALMTFLGSWTAFLWPLLVLSTPENFTMPLGLVRFTAGWGDPFRGIGPTMAGAFLAVLPTLIIFVLGHRYLMRGISLGAIGK